MTAPSLDSLPNGAGSAPRAPAAIVAPVRYRFGGYELDLPQRELRHQGRPQSIQPQVYSLLAYLVEHRSRVVPKHELLDVIWPDAVVTEGSLQRAISLARSALKHDSREFIRTFARHGYRFVAEVLADEGGVASPRPQASARPTFKTRYVASGDVHVAYQTLGDGDLDLVLVLGWTFPMQALVALPEGLDLVQRLTGIGRVVLFDKRGTGLSDRVKALPTLAQRMEDLKAVLDEVGSERAILVGLSEGGPLCVAFAHAHPERVSGLALVGSFPRMASAPDYPQGWKRSEVARLRGYVRGHWGKGATVLAFASERASDLDVRSWAASAEMTGASPGAALDLLEMNLQIDVRDRLAELRVPTVVMHAAADPVIDFANGQYLAEHIPAARFVELPGADHTGLFEGRGRMVEELRALATRHASRAGEGKAKS
jgi:pimeloyl-ACP methyl ester carboxylesterase/DNA-binding winged helix-turn-helix (wHTH) protein